jgi:hypothetical protein
MRGTEEKNERKEKKSTTQKVATGAMGREIESRPGTER